MKGILLDKNNEIVVRNGSVVIGNTLLQEVAIIAGMNQGECKEDPLLGPNLIRMVKSNASRAKVEKAMRIAFARDRKNYDEIKHLIQAQ